MGIISLLPNNRIKPLFSNNFSWHLNGPMDQFLRDVVLPRFFESDFSDEDAIRVGDVSPNRRKFRRTGIYTNQQPDINFK
jgi:hypothetical protein